MTDLIRTESPIRRWSWGKFWQAISYLIIAFSFGWGIFMGFADILHSQVMDSLGIEPKWIFGPLIIIMAINTLAQVYHWKADKGLRAFISLMSFVAFICGAVGMQVTRNDRANIFFAKHQDLSLHTLEIGSTPITLVNGDKIWLAGNKTPSLAREIIQQFPDGTSRRVTVMMRDPVTQLRVANTKLASGYIMVSLPGIGQLSFGPSSDDIEFANRRIEGDVPDMHWADLSVTYLESIPVCGQIIIHAQSDGNDTYSSRTRTFEPIQITGRHLLVLDGDKVQILQHDGLRPTRIPVTTCTNNNN